MYNAGSLPDSNPSRSGLSRRARLAIAFLLLLLGLTIPLAIAVLPVYYDAPAPTMEYQFAMLALREEGQPTGTNGWELLEALLSEVHLDADSDSDFAAFEHETWREGWAVAKAACIQRPFTLRCRKAIDGSVWVRRLVRRVWLPRLPTARS